MKYFGLNYIGHDAGVVVFDENGKLEFYAEAERFGARNKNCKNIKPIIDFIPTPKKNDIVCVVSNQSEKDLPICKEYNDLYARSGKEKINLFNFKSHVNLVIDHHLCHCLSSWCFRPDDEERLFLSYDGFGSDGYGDLKSYLVGNISKNNFSIIEDCFPIFSSALLANLIGENSAGKLMGLHGFNTGVKKNIWTNEELVNLVDSIYCLFGIKKTRWQKEENFAENKQLMDYVCSIYRLTTTQIWNDLKKNIDHFAHNRGVVLGGGSALALEVNSLVKNQVKDVVFGPPVNDSGLALGAAAFAYWHINKEWPKIKSPSLNFLQSELPKIGPQKTNEIAKLIASNNFIGLLRGKSEAGPRSLGFRSILASAGKKENLEIVSQQLKGREFYRPLAPVVTEQSFDRYFIGPKGKYMQYKVECTEEAQKELPAIVHKDNSARPQVVCKENDPWFHELLVEYGKITGHECMINTSLNGKGKPICNTYQDAINDFGENNKIILTSISQKFLI